VEWIVARWLTYVATLVITGACAVGVLLLPRATLDVDARRVLAREAARAGIGAALFMIPASLLRLADQVMALRSPGDPLMPSFSALLLSTMWGTGFLIECAALVVAGIGLTMAVRTPGARPWWALAALGAAGLCATPALQGHAIGSEEFTSLAVAADIAHVLGASLWLGTLSVIGWLGVTLPNTDGVVTEERAARADARLRVLVPLVPPIALPGAALLITSGVIASVLHLRAIPDLWSDEWGRYVLAKTIAACAIVLLGALNWRRLGPRMAGGGGTASIRKSLITELLIALLILIVTAVLVVTPLPGESDTTLRDGLESQHLGFG
jgi:putative copper export protein